MINDHFTPPALLIYSYLHYRSGFSFGFCPTFTAFLCLFRGFQGGIASNEERGQRADRATKQSKEEDIVHTQRRGLLAHTGLESRVCMRRLRSAGRGCIFDMARRLLRQIARENGYANRAENCFRRTHQRRSFGHLLFAHH